MQAKIPKILHYCWFGRGPKPKSFEYYLKTWRRHCPDYQIVEWNEENFDVELNRFVSQAYRAKKYAFVSDYVRLAVLEQEGGIYLDTDVEIVKSFDKLLELESFIGFEGEQFIGTSVIGSTAGNSMLRTWLTEFYSGDFIKPNGEFDIKTNVMRISEWLQARGLKANGCKQAIEGLTILPTDFFSPKDMITKKLAKTVNTVSIHHFDGSWFTPSQKFKMAILKLAGKRGSQLILDCKKKLRGR